MSSLYETFDNESRSCKNPCQIYCTRTIDIDIDFDGNDDEECRCENENEIENTIPSNTTPTKSLSCLFNFSPCILFECSNQSSSMLLQCVCMCVCL